MTANPAYIPHAIEAKWQRSWEERDLFRARPYQGEKFYCYNPAPYVTGALHMGHVRNYSYGDFLSRFKRLHGANVLFTIGFDAFGVPTEVAAMRKGIEPVVWTERCISEMKKQMRRMGFGFDWRRSFSTADPDYYRWTQWIFIEMFREGLVYETDAETLWCPRCEMALAKSLTEEGRCGLCGTEVETRLVPQWFIRISRYLDRLRTDLDDVFDHNGQARAGQESLLARHSLWGVRLEIPGVEGPVIGCLDSPTDWPRKLVLAVHPQDWPTRARLGLRGASVPGTLVALERRSGREFPVLIDPSLGDLYIDQPRLVPASGAERHEETGAWEGPPDGLVPLLLHEQKDFSISRQRLWGTPIPMVRCERCGSVPVGASELPVLLPPIALDGAGRLRRSGDQRRERACPSCGHRAAMDPQVMDCHFDALWHYWRPCAPSGDTFPFGTEEGRYWMPVDQIQFGRDTIPFLLTMRLFTKFLQDRGLSDCSEFARETLAHGLILRDNRKMSKHIGNVVDPEESVAAYGADSLRFCVLAKSEPKSDYSWSDESIAPYREMLGMYYGEVAAPGHPGGPEAATGASESPSAPQGETTGGPQRSMKYATIFLTKILREIEILESSVGRGRFDIYARAVERILGALHLFRSQYYGSSGPWARAAWAKCADLSVIYLAPIAPHLAEECWERRGGSGSVFEGNRWPSEGPSVVRRLLEEAKLGGSVEA